MIQNFAAMRRTPDEPTQGTEPHFRHTVGIIGHYVIILDTLEGHLRPFYRRGPKKPWKMAKWGYAHLMPALEPGMNRSIWPRRSV